MRVVKFDLVTMKKLLSENLIKLADSCPYPLYVVGGRVRDFLAGFSPEKYDNDICAPATAEDFVERAENAGFKINAVYGNTGTVKLTCNGEDYEFTSFRSDEYVRGVHRPVNTFFTDDIGLDARRRDFKCNAVYYDISAGQFVDPLGGIEDIKAKRLTTVAPAEKVFGEDGLRLMRLARFASQTGFEPTRDCLDGATRNAGLISDVSVERIYAELDQILHGEEKYGVQYASYKGLNILRETGVLKIILPELALGDGMEQRSDIHGYDVLEHSFRAVMYADKSIRLSALLHDVGKPACMLKDGNFYDHAEVGAQIALNICARLRVSAKITEQVYRLTRFHMFDFDCRTRENKIRKFIVKNLEYFDKLMLLKQADFSACKDDLSPAPSVVRMCAVFDKMKAEGAPMTLKELDVRGDELIKAGIAPKSVGAVLNALLLDCAIGQVRNEKDVLIKHASKVAIAE